MLTDFTRDDGIFMHLTGKEPLKGAQMNRVQRMMLSSVAIPHLLPFIVREVDDDVSLQYNITGKKMLSQCLRQDKLELTEFYSLLLQIVTVLEESRQYMLSPDQFYLDEDYIFVEEPLSLAVLHFTYVPLKQAIREEPLPQVFLKLVTKIMACVDNMNGNGIQKLLRWCSDDRFTLAETRQLISNFITDTGPQQPEPNKIEAQFKVKEYVRTNEEQAQSPVVSPSPEWRMPVAPQWKMPKAPMFSDEGEEEEYERGPQSSSVKTYIVLGTVLAAAMLWKFVYLDHPGTGSLWISLLGTLLLTGGILLSRIGFKLPLPKIGIHKNVEQEEQAEQNNGLGAYRYPLDEDELSLLSNWVRDEKPVTVQEEVQVRKEIEKNPPELIVRPPQTVLLSRSGLDKEHKIGAAAYSLERTSRGSSGGETITLSKGSFVIGRSEEIAQYIDNTPGVSRAHVELMVKTTGCTLKDLGSRNGTVLGEELMAPYKEYPLSPGDTFSIAGSKYTLWIDSLYFP
nr:DUF6382 domain-containing protein [Paenibacillus brevis]